MSVKSAIAAVEKNAKKNDASKTKEALIDWAQLNYQDSTITNLAQLTEHCCSQLAQQVRRLNESMYSSEKHAWQGKGLLKAFDIEQSLKNKKAGTRSSTLKPLYDNK